jgi:hypothetical protein
VKIRNWLLLAVMGVSLAIGTARPSAAATITYDVIFSANSFLTVGTGTPESLVMGRASVTFDPVADVIDSSNGTLDFLDPLSMPAALVFTYTKASDRLVLGGSLNGLLVLGGTNDFFVEVQNFTSGSPIMASLFYAQTTSPLGFFLTSSGLVHVNATAVATTPIPAALPLLISALGGLGFFGWRRRKSAAA